MLNKGSEAELYPRDGDGDSELFPHLSEPGVVTGLWSHTSPLMRVSEKKTEKEHFIAHTHLKALKMEVLCQPTQHDQYTHK